MAKSEYLFLKKLIGHKSICLENGLYAIWGVKMFFFPYGLFTILEKNMEEAFPKEAGDIIYSMGFVQAYNGTKVLIDSFGIKADEEMHGLMTNQGETFGFGDFVFSNKKLKEKPIFVKKTVNPIAEEYKRRYGEGGKVIDQYNLGLIVGASEAWYKRSIRGRETRCIAKGDDVCEFEIKPSNSKMKKLIADMLERERLTTLLKR